MDSFGVNFLNLEYFFNQVYLFFLGLTGWFTGDNFSLGFLSSFFESLLFLSILLSVLFIVGIVYFWQRLEWLRKIDADKYATTFLADLSAKPERNLRWEQVLKLIDSDNESEWKLAILEADKLLDEMVAGMGYLGANLGERLKVIEPSDFTTLQQAWEAHKVRNRLAHEHGFRLTHREAKRVIELFGAVFREFNFI